MKSVLISIKPKWCEKIAYGRKKTEIRKTRPNIQAPFKCFIYQTKHKWICDFLRSHKIYSLAYKLDVSKGKVIGEFICDRVHEFKVFEDGSVQDWWFGDVNKSCLKYEEVAEYIGRNKTGYSWHISNLVIYDKPKELSDFNGVCARAHCSEQCKSFKKTCNLFEDGGKKTISQPPQSWCYVDC